MHKHFTQTGLFSSYLITKLFLTNMTSVALLTGFTILCYLKEIYISVVVAQHQ